MKTDVMIRVEKSTRQKLKVKAIREGSTLKAYLKKIACHK